MRWLCALIFAVAAGSSALAASGLAVPPHIDPPGTPRFHDHLLAAYRYPLFLMRLKMLGRSPAGPGWSLESPSQTELGALTLAILVLGIAKLPRPTRRAVATLPVAGITAPEWRACLPQAPPRPQLLAFA
ncbi:MAG: hypothetical protein M3O64_00340 [Chloroflexota bacterium]|nr:hypothetical protein [Chloroflexota bacterium]